MPYWITQCYMPLDRSYDVPRYVCLFVCWFVTPRITQYGVWMNFCETSWNSWQRLDSDCVIRVRIGDFSSTYINACNVLVAFNTQCCHLANTGKLLRNVTWCNIGDAGALLLILTVSYVLLIPTMWNVKRNNKCCIVKYVLKCHDY